MLRRLLPGIVQTTPNAGYYAFYPYLLARWEDVGGSIASVDFKPWYRRHEVAFVLACALHGHRGDLGGVVGIDAIRRALDGATGDVDITRLAAEGPGGYLKNGYGGFGMYYRAVLRDLRLSIEGLGSRVDRVTDAGRQVAEAFAQVFETTTYFQDFQEADRVPLQVLEELGQHVCLCSIPNRIDHPLLLDAFFGEPSENPRWEARRRTRVSSFGLFLEFHDQRPEAVRGSLGSWRRAIAAHRFRDGSAWETSFPQVRQSWRAYQIREAETIALLGLWVSFLLHLTTIEPAARIEVRDHLVADADWEAVGIDVATPTGDALVALAESLRTPEDLIEAATGLERVQHADPGTYVVDCLRVLASCIREVGSEEEGSRELIDEGGPGRWSLQHLGRWLAERSSVPVGNVLGELIDAMVYQHQAVALGKVSPTGARDPFCIAEDNGLMRIVRSDDPSWTGARFSTVNHLLWTLGLLDDPDGSSRLTTLGHEMLSKARSDA